MKRMTHILVVEDDREIRTMVCRLLQKNGFRLSSVGDALAMDRVLATAHIDLLILDLMLPGEDGLSICRRLRTASSMPIIMLTASGDPVARVVGLEMGADDYVPKPFDPHELVARVRAVLRRSNVLPAASNAPALTDEASRAVLAFAGWRIDPVARELANPEGVRVMLTGAEFNLLLVFCRHARRTLTRDQLLDLTQGREPTVFDRSIDILVSRIRRKIEDNPRAPMLIKTVRSGGYIFTPEVTSE
jgi:two-component system OmpR family response regulator